MNSKGNTITIKIFWPAMTRSYGIALSNRSGSFCLILNTVKYEFDTHGQSPPRRNQL